MGNAASTRTFKRPLLMAILSMLIGLTVPLLVLEGILHFLPVNGGLKAQPVNDENPVFRFSPNRTLTWSKGWNFSIVNKIRINNAGFVNDQIYSTSDERSLLAVVGDSYVEAAMVPYSETLHGRLAPLLAPRARVYSFAASGAPLSQYVIWAREARHTWGANKLAIVIIANDFDESLAEYKQAPGFHHYVRDGSGALFLRQFDYKPNPLRQLVRLSALARYLFFNVQVHERVRMLLASDWHAISTAFAQTYVGNTSAKAGSKRMRDSQDAVAAFLRDLVELAGWSPSDVVFLVDGIRYPTSDKVILQSYFVRMRHHFMDTARKAGFEAIDLDPLFFAHYAETGDRFEYPTDAHWNGTAHGIAAKALAASAMVKGW